MFRWTVRALGALFLAIALGVIAGMPGPGGPTPTAEAQIASGTFIGRLPGTQTLVGVVFINGESVTVYVTDGIQQADWFRFSLQTVIAPIQSATARSGAQLALATAAGAAPRGVMAISGVQYEFTAAPATGLAGVYRAVAQSGDTTLLAGWIVTNEGEVRGALIQRMADGPDIVIPLDASSLDPSGRKATIPGYGAVEVTKLGEL